MGPSYYFCHDKATPRDKHFVAIRLYQLPFSRVPTGRSFDAAAAASVLLGVDTPLFAMASGLPSRPPASALSSSQNPTAARSSRPPLCRPSWIHYC